jgi:hypothetical protein
MVESHDADVTEGTVLASSRFAYLTGSALVIFFINYTVKFKFFNRCLEVLLGYNSRRGQGSQEEAHIANYHNQRSYNFMVLGDIGMVVCYVLVEANNDVDKEASSS